MRARRAENHLETPHPALCSHYVPSQTYRTYTGYFATSFLCYKIHTAFIFLEMLLKISTTYDPSFKRNEDPSPLHVSLHFLTLARN